MKTAKKNSVAEAGSAVGNRQTAASPDNDALPPVGIDPDAPTPAPDIEKALKQTIDSALNFGNWEEGSGLIGFGKAQAHLAKSLENQKRHLKNIRKYVLAELPSFNNAPAAAGVYKVSDGDLRAARRLMLSGRMTAARGASVGHEGLATSLVSVGVCLTRYDGQIRSWRTVFLRHDCDVRTDDPVDEIRAILNQQARRGRDGPGSKGSDTVSRLMRRAFQSAAERKSLLERAGPGWRMGYGPAVPYDLLTGSGAMKLIDAVLPMLDALLLQDKRWVFIPDSLNSPAFRYIAAALEPGQLAIIQKAKPTLDTIVDSGHYEGGYRAKVRKFADAAGDAIVIGGFRSSPFAPARLFFAHAEHAIHAGLLAMADAEHQPHRGFPLLLELAGISCTASLGVEAFRGMVESTYAKAGAGNFYLPESVDLSQADE